MIIACKGAATLGNPLWTLHCLWELTERHGRVYSGMVYSKRPIGYNAVQGGHWAS